MGDLIMTAPALRAIKQTFNSKITVLTSVMGNLIAPCISEIDEVLVYDLPWIKTDKPVAANDFSNIINCIRSHQFDGCIIFTVYSQNPLPAAMLAFMAGIPKRLAYCRENPYHLLTDWVPEKEPYSAINHQVKRDLDLVAEIDAKTNDDRLSLHFSDKAKTSALQKLADAGVDISKEWIVIHAGVSEKKREYPAHLFGEAGKLINQYLNIQILLTGSAGEKHLADEIKKEIGINTFSIAGLLNIEEFIAIISETSVAISVNTATVHIAAATNTPVVVLYALTNPQHTPWKVRSQILPFHVKEELQSKNEVVNYVTQKLSYKKISFPSPEDILLAVWKLITENKPKQTAKIIQF